MNGDGTLPAAMQAYLVRQSRENIKALEDALDQAGVPEMARSAFWFACEIAIEEKRNAQTQTVRADELKELLIADLNRPVSANAQAGNGNALQTGDGTQTVNEQPPQKGK